MTEPDLKETEPLFWAYGHAVYAVQLLENGMRLLLLVVGHERQKSGLPRLEIRLDAPGSKKTLGTLFNVAD